ncbi:hypothetical protein ACA910_006504 [Epithemia clementina (nom. ined.)]
MEETTPTINNDDNTKEYTLDEIAKHNTAESCWLIIGNATNGGPKVYDVTKYLDDHPGGAEVMLDVAGQDADEFFEDIGHSKEARHELKRHLIGNFKLDEAAKAKLAAAAEAAKAKAQQANSTVVSGMVTMVVFVALVAAAVGYYQTQMAGGSATGKEES